MPERDLLAHAAGAVYGVSRDGGVLFITWTETPSAIVVPRAPDGTMLTTLLNVTVSPELAGEVKWFVKKITESLRPQDAAAALTVCQAGSHELVVMIDPDGLNASASLFDKAERSAVALAAINFRPPQELVH